MVDDLVLSFQRVVDRIARWARLGPTEVVPRRRFLIVQIDGLSRAVFEHALRAGGIPNMQRLITSQRFVRRFMSVGLPSSTPAFQAAAMYGVKPDIPGFHYYDKRARRELHIPEAGVADFVEAYHAEGRRGILEGGSCYGCVFTGGAENSLLTFARLMKPTRAGLPLLRLVPSVALLGWVIAKCLWLTAGELGRFLWRLAFHRRSVTHDGLRWLGLKIVFSIWLRELFTLSVSADLYRGVPAVYVNFLDYDVFAHAFGPAHKAAFRALRQIDNAIGQLMKTTERLPELAYDLYVLSDHGQTLTRTFIQVSGGRTLEDVARDLLGREHAQKPPAAGRPASMGVARQLAGYRRPGARGILQRFFNHLERQLHRSGDEAEPSDSVRIITAGPNAFVYFLDSPEPVLFEEIERRHPGAAALLSKHPGIGLVLARSAEGPLCWWRGEAISLGSDGSDGPFADREDRQLVLAGLRDLMAMRSAGDLVVYGIGAPESDVSFIPERGAHAGPSEHELQTFIIHPVDVEVPESVNHPVELYPHFAAYLESAPSQDTERCA
jgi:hypothetical protein